jgi:hypothetical protein
MTHPVTLYGPLADALMTVTLRRYITRRYDAWAKRARREYARELREERRAGRPSTPPTWAPQRMPPPSTPTEWIGP